MIKLYRVTKGQFCGGFIVAEGKVITSAPFLRKLTLRKTEEQALQSVFRHYSGAKVELVHEAPNK